MLQSGSCCMHLLYSCFFVHFLLQDGVTPDIEKLSDRATFLQILTSNSGSDASPCEIWQIQPCQRSNQHPGGRPLRSCIMTVQAETSVVLNQFIPEILNSPGRDYDGFKLFLEVAEATLIADDEGTNGSVAAIGPTSASGGGAGMDLAPLPRSAITDVTASYPASDRENEPVFVGTSESELSPPMNLDTLVAMMIQRPGIALSDIRTVICQHTERDAILVDMSLTGLLL